MTLLHGDCREMMATLEAASIDSIVTDPPYGLSFMGQGWDHGVPSVEFWREAFRVAKDGAHLLAFGGTRTYHRLACAIEDAGWEIRDTIAWISSKTFPKSLNVSKAIDKAAGAEREVIGHTRGVAVAQKDNQFGGINRGSVGIKQTAVDVPITVAATEAARQWNGWGTALKPVLEPIVMARKPLCGTVAKNVLTNGTGAINVDGCRVDMGSEYDPTKMQRQQHSNGAIKGAFGAASLVGKAIPTYKRGGRHPANLIHDGSEEVTARMGEAARYFYCAKASKADRDDGNNHPTVKPTALMRYLCRLVTQPNGIVLDPFCGSGSTGKAAVLEGFRFVGIEREAEYVEIARARIAAVQGVFA